MATSICCDKPMVKVITILGNGNDPCRHKYRFPVVSRRLLHHPIALEPGRVKGKPSRPARSSLTMDIDTDICGYVIFQALPVVGHFHFETNELVGVVKVRCGWRWWGNCW